MKIDFHVHITPPDLIQNPEKLYEREPYFALLSQSPKNKFATGEDVADMLHREGMDAAVVFGFGFRDQGLCRYVNDYTAEMAKQHPGRLIGYMALSPKAEGLEKEMDRSLALGLKGVGELFPDGQQFALEDEAETRLLGGCLAERSLPVIIHSNEPVGHYYPGKTTTTPVKLDAFVQHHPDVKTVFAHWGGGLFFYELMPELKEKYQNVYYDTAASTFLYHPKVYEVCKTAGVLHKVLLGSDYPLLPPSRNLGELEQTALSAADKEMICGQNALRFLGWNPAE